MISATALCRTLIVAALAALLAFAPAHAQQLVTIVTTTVSWTYEENIEDDGILLDETDALLGDEGLGDGALAAAPGETRRYAPAATLATLGHARRSEEHTSELQSLMRSSYAGFC